MQRKKIPELDEIVQKVWLVGWLVLRHVNLCWIILCQYNSYAFQLYMMQKSIFTIILIGLVLWHINHCKLFNAKSIFIHINSYISNYSV